MTVKEVMPSPAARAVLPMADFADAYEGEFPGAASALHVAKRVFDKPYPILEGLMWLRNALVKPFGLVTSAQDLPMQNRFIGFFPILEESPERLILGVDDKHLDFRLIVDLNTAQGRSVATATTLVRTHGCPGRIYMVVVKPFHRWLVPALLRRANSEKPLLGF